MNPGIAGPVFENSLSPMILINDQRCIVKVNHAALKLGFKKREELEGVSIDKLMPEELLKESYAYWQEMLEKDSLTGPWPIKTSEGEKKEISFALTANIKPGLHLAILFMEGEDNTPQARSAQAGESPLSEREREILQMVALGQTVDEIADALFLSHETVRTHIRNTRLKLGAANQAHAVAIALKNKEFEV